MIGTKVSFNQIALATGLALTLASVACDGNENQQNTGSNTEIVKEASTQEQVKDMKKVSATEQIAFSKQDLAARLDVELDAVNLSGARPVTWRSGALGCPEPGMNYTQALVPGVLIFLRVGNEVHGYHAKHGGKPFYCPRERAEQPVFGQGADMT